MTAENHYELDDTYEAADGGEDESMMYGDKEVRWYQIAALHQVEQELEKGVKRILVELPTGAGKTVTSGLIFSSDRIRKASSRTSRCVCSSSLTSTAC
jgi:superfamily II DNA or RNA helicase